MGQNFLDVWDGNQQKIYSTFKDFIWYIAEDANTQTGVKVLSMSCDLIKRQGCVYHHGCRNTTK